jgi:RNA polymerase sigma-B factor
LTRSSRPKDTAPAPEDGGPMRRAETLDHRDAENERRMFARLHDPRDPLDDDEVLRRYLPLARHIAGRFRGLGESEEDLVQVASLGLLRAVRRFDPNRGTRFSSYAMPTITGEVRRHLRDATWFVHVPRNLQELALHVDRCVRDLTARNGRVPTVDEVADALKCTPEEVVEGRRALGAHFSVSLDTPSRADDDAPPQIEAMGDADRGYDRVASRDGFDVLLRAVPRRDREILRLRYEHDLTQREIGRRVGVSQMHVSRVLKDRLARLRDVLGDEAYV